MKEKHLIRIFEAHGVSFNGERGNQLYGYDPFSGKDDKFYVNRKNGLWDSKSAGLSGNISKFLELRAKDYESTLTDKLARRLGEHRQLPSKAFRNTGMGWDGRNFTFPVRDNQGHVQDIRKYSVKSKLMMSTSGCQVGLLGAEQLREKPNAPVYLCEGEWDAFALRWLLKFNGVEGVVVAVPGAATFKDEWAEWLRGRNVTLLYDADPPGQKGEEVAAKRLKNVAKSLKYVHWPDDVPSGFDTRDWIVYGCTIHDTPDICWERLQRRFQSVPKWEEPKTSSKKGKIVVKRKRHKTRWQTPPTLSQVHEVFNKWLFLKNTDAIDIMLATVLSQRIDGSPVWMFLVGPPGSAKTAIVSSLLKGIDEIYGTSTLTAPSLISGANFTGQGDPSLIPKLNGRTLVVKDFTSILSVPDREQKEIFGILRDAYDGRCGKTFGNGVERNFESRFTMLAAVTPRIYDLSEQHAALGERFLKFMVGDNLHHESENESIRRAIENADRETAMREEFQDVTKAFLEKSSSSFKDAKLPEEILHKIIALAKFGARMRGSVSRDLYRNEIVTSRPMAEVGTRLGQQLSKLARGLAMIHGKPEVTEIEYRLVKKVVLDTISQRNEDMLRIMITAMSPNGQPAINGTPITLTPMSLRDIATKSHYPFETIRRMAQDLQALQIIKRHGGGALSTWTVSDYVKREIEEAKLYDKETLERPSRRMVLRRPHKVKFKRTIRVPLGQVDVQSTSGKITITNPQGNGDADEGKGKSDVRVRTTTT